MNSLWTIEVLKENKWVRFADKKTYDDTGDLNKDLELVRNFGYTAKAVEYKKVEDSGY
jgi:hypothetical protein